VTPLSDHQHRVVVCLLRGLDVEPEVLQVAVDGVEPVGASGSDLCDPPFLSSPTEAGEGGRVAATLRSEVAPESEHVRPRPQPQVEELGLVSQHPGRFDHDAGVGGDLKGVNRCR
jgi:hypothetical protein